MEYIVMPEESCFPLTGKLNADHGSISEPLAIGVYAVKKTGDVKGLKIGILGYEAAVWLPVNERLKPGVLSGVEYSLG